jgi:hypothetical protein
MDSRPCDSFGVGFYDNVVSDNFKNSISRLTQGTSSAADERGVELFYDFAITPFDATSRRGSDPRDAGARLGSQIRPSKTKQKCLDRLGFIRPKS